MDASGGCEICTRRKGVALLIIPIVGEPSACVCQHCVEAQVAGDVKAIRERRRELLTTGERNAKG